MKFHISPTISILAVSTLVFTVGFFFLIAPELTPIGENFARLHTYSSVNVSTPTVKDTTAALSAQASLAEALLPQGNQLYDLSVQIEALAHSDGVSLTGLSLNPAVQGEPATTSNAAQAGSLILPSNVHQSSLVVTASGSYADLQSFVIGLTELKRYIDIQDLAMSQAANTNPSVQVTAVAYNLSNDND